LRKLKNGELSEEQIHHLIVSHNHDYEQNEKKVIELEPQFWGLIVYEGAKGAREAENREKAKT